MVRTAMCLAGVVGVAYLGLVILFLSLFTSEYSPITQVASDYGVGTYGPEMNSGFFLAGVGVLCMALVVVPSGRRDERVGGVLLALAGLALVTNAFFQTDLEGAAATLHGTVHALAGVVFFIMAPVGLLLVNHGLGRRRFFFTLGAFAAVVAALALDGILGLNASGLAERVAILAIFSSLILTSLAVLRES